MKKEHIERGRQDGKSDRTKPAEITKQNYRLQLKYNSRRDFWCKEGGGQSNHHQKRRLGNTSVTSLPHHCSVTHQNEKVVQTAFEKIAKYC